MSAAVDCGAVERFAVTPPRRRRASWMARALVRDARSRNARTVALAMARRFSKVKAAPLPPWEE